MSVCPLQRLAERFEVALSLTPAEAAIVARLHQAGSVWVTTEYLNDVTAPYARGERYRMDQRSKGTVKVHVANIRAKRTWDFILGHVQHGWTLGAPGVLACRRVLREGS